MSNRKYSKSRRTRHVGTPKHRPKRGHGCNNSIVKWSVRRFRIGSPSGPAAVEFTFPTEEGGVGQLRVAHSELRHPKRLLDEFSNHLPVFPTTLKSDDQSRFQYIQDLVDSHTGEIELVPAKTGFLDKNSFATHSEVLTAGGRRREASRLAINEAHQFADLPGSIAGTTNDILKLGKYSTYLVFGIGVALAAPLPTYLRLHRKGTNTPDVILTETAVFNLSGRSSSGKSSVCLAAMSLAGSPDRAGILDFSRRGLAELAADSNDLLLVLDDTEKAGHGELVKALKSIVHTVPGGRSRHISKGVDQSKFPELQWSTFGLCSSPRPIPALAAERRWEMSPGEKVRLFDISVPGPHKGGIFDRLNGAPAERARRSVQLIGQLERGYTNNHGQLIPEWIWYLLATDRSGQIVKSVHEFVKHVRAEGNGWEKRFAQKFGVIYAAMVLGIAAHLLPWPEHLPLKVVTKCYRKARNAARTEVEHVAYAAKKLSDILAKIGRMIVYPSRMRKGKFLKIPARCIAIRYTKGNRVTIGVFDDALLKLLKTRKAKTRFTAALAGAGVIGKGHGHAGTVQEHFPIDRNGETIVKPHLWPIDRKRFSKFLRKAVRP